jgi:hypothetical protein
VVEGDGQGTEASALLGAAGDDVDELVARLSRMRPPSWRGPAADAFADGLGRAVRDLREADEALRRARGAARRLGAP